MVATGNESGGMMVDVVPFHSIEPRSRSWNALSIGGLARKGRLPALPPTLEAVVPANDPGPSRRGSQALADDLMPTKSEMLFGAGNMLPDETGFSLWHEVMSLLTLGSQIASEPLVPFSATSAAAGVAGHVVGRVQAA